MSAEFLQRVKTARPNERHGPNQVSKSDWVLGGALSSTSQTTGHKYSKTARGGDFFEWFGFFLGFFFVCMCVCVPFFLFLFLSLMGVEFSFLGKAIIYNFHNVKNQFLWS